MVVSYAFCTLSTFYVLWGKLHSSSRPQSCLIACATLVRFYMAVLIITITGERKVRSVAIQKIKKHDHSTRTQ